MTSCDGLPEVSVKTSALICGGVGNPCATEATCPGGTDAECLSPSNVTKGDTSCAVSAKCVNNQCQYVSWDATHVCRAKSTDPTDVCDADDTCDPMYLQGGGVPTTTAGPWQCPVKDDLQPSTKMCRDIKLNSTCDVVENCTGSSRKCPADGFALSTVTCRGVADVCDQAEKCTGTSPDCPNDTFLSSATVCRAAATGPAGACDISESCTGTSAACPMDKKQPPAHQCGNKSTAGTDVCDADDFCDGVNNACPDLFLSGNTCRMQVMGGCDVKAETCSGTAKTCPADDNSSLNGHICRDVIPANACDVAEKCDGVNPACPADGVASIATTCGNPKNPDTTNFPCDLADHCDGSTKTCPDIVQTKAANFVCRDAGTHLCDISETCDGVHEACPADVKQLSTFVCRKAVDVCDAAELCDGTSIDCPATDAKQPPTKMCGTKNGACDLDDFCDGTNNACPDKLADNTVVCRAFVPGSGTASTCDVGPEKCTGTSKTCPTDVVMAKNTVCRAQVPGSGTVLSCDVAEVCDGTNPSCPADSFAKNTITCRTAVNKCDAAENCTGASATCPADLLAGSGTPCTTPAKACATPGTCNGTNTTCGPEGTATTAVVCRKAVAGGCDIAENCDGTSLDCPTDKVQPINTTCRDTGLPCDIPEKCDGVADTCPVDAIEPNTFACHPLAGVCDVAEFCPGGAATTANKQCPADKKLTSVCRGAADLCDAVESCDGVTNDCPADKPSPKNTVCRAAVGAPGVTCDIAEVCDGTVITCPTDAKKGPGVTCRDLKTGSLCDVAEICDGTNAACPTDGFKANTISCRDVNGTCDVAELCPGNSPDCPTDKFVLASANQQCRMSAGDCDPAENCDGTQAGCPADKLAPNTQVCRNDSSKGCDVAEKCTGTTTTCPINGFKAIATPCRNSAGACDIAETCSGLDDVCPSDTFQPPGTLCRGAADVCDVPESCTGTAAGCPADKFLDNTNKCHMSGGVCDNDEFCSGSSASCNTNSHKADGTNCDNGTVCDGVSMCKTGACQAGTPLTCTTTNPCLVASCDPVKGCQTTKVADGTMCSDGKYCTTGDVCTNGVCAGVPKVCGTPTETCVVAQCDEASASCKLIPNPDGTVCKDDAGKPYMMVIVDNSASMSTSTGAGNNSCGVAKSRISDAKCVLTDIVNSYGEVVFGLERFKETPKPTAVPSAGSDGCGTGVCLGGSVCPSGCNACDDNYLLCSSCDTSTGAGCPTGGGDATQGEVLAPIQDHKQTNILRWIDNSINTCANSGTGDPELGAHTSTPIAGSLRTAQKYFQGTDPTYPGTVIDTTNACRPYYVILLTDGNETCTTFNDTLAATTQLRTTTVGTQTYDIKTYVIEVGFSATDPAGIAASQIAAAGGTNAAYFATDEQSLALAFADILKKSVLVEVCNGKDDNCNGLIDEGFTLYCDLKSGHTASDLCTNPGDPCDGTDDNCFDGTADEMHNACGTCGMAPVEVCDKLDNNCDGKIDEGLDCSCFVAPEICDNLDNDCDGQIDNGLTRPCGVELGACHAGTETCVAGAWKNCTATNGMTEICNGVDDNCDGTIDGITQPCGTSNVGACQLGTQLCTGGVFGACTGDVEPTTEVCDNIDNNCDGSTDEGNPGGGASCSTACGPGSVQCKNGKLVCVADNSMTIPEVCNGIDDNCNNEIDEGLDNEGPCDNDGKLCVPGILKCLKGTQQCVGGVPPKPEVCDCKDNDCNSQIDEGDLCGAGGKCLASPYCACAFPCGSGEFPCPAGFRCDTLDNGDRFCVTDPCANVQCPPIAGNLQVCVAGKCTGICDSVTCPTGDVCRPRDGQCVTDNCINFPSKCMANEQCVGGVCVADPCTGVTCPDGDFCRGGSCVDSCATIYCGSAQRCHNGACVDDPCATFDCTDPTVCVVKGSAATCVTNPCIDRLPVCAPGLVCNPSTNECLPNPCDGIKCPMGEVCGGPDGDCFLPNGLPDIAGEGARYIAAVGGGGAGCSASGGLTTTFFDSLAILFALVSLYLIPRRRAIRVRTRNQRGGSR